MNSSTASVRERLIGRDLLGFDTRADVVRAPRAKAGGIGEGGVKPGSKAVRESLIGKDLLGFDTRANLVRAPRAKAGLGESGVQRGDVKQGA